MQRVKRVKYLHVSFESRVAVDTIRLLSGEMSLVQRDRAVAKVLHYDKEYILSAADLSILARTSSEAWSDAENLARDASVTVSEIGELINCGLLIEDNEAARETLNIQDRLSDISWDLSAFYFHFATKLKKKLGVSPPAISHETLKNLTEESASRFAQHLAKYGNPPHHFHSVLSKAERIALTNDDYDSDFSGLLQQRSTTRIFDSQKRMDKKQFACLLRLIFGFQGSVELSEGLVALKKTSPSGGALHPIEVYPLVIGVDGVAIGLYHYHVGDHALEPMKLMDEQEARSLITEVTAGQSYYTSAHVVFLYTARFQRSFWKYRQHPRAYKVLLMDLGHLSQSLYLLCADMGLGAFFTAACNEGSIETLLGIDGIEEGALAVSGCGIVPENDKTLKFIPKFGDQDLGR